MLWCLMDGEMSNQIPHATDLQLFGKQWSNTCILVNILMKDKRFGEFFWKKLELERNGGDTVERAIFFCVFPDEIRIFFLNLLE